MRHTDMYTVECRNYGLYAPSVERRNEVRPEVEKVWDELEKNMIEEFKKRFPDLVIKKQ